MFDKPRRRSFLNLNLVPIMDMLVTVIFFLLLSITFIEFTKQTIPPSSVSTIEDPLRPPPVNPKLYMGRTAQGLKAVLEWTGVNPGVTSTFLEVPSETRGAHKVLREQIDQMIKKFKESYPEVNTLQLGLARDLDYQIMMAVMDGVRMNMGDVVLASYVDAEAAIEKLGDGNGI